MRPAHELDEPLLHRVDAAGERPNGRPALELLTDHGHRVLAGPPTVGGVGSAAEDAWAFDSPGEPAGQEEVPQTGAAPDPEDPWSPAWDPHDTPVSIEPLTVREEPLRTRNLKLSMVLAAAGVTFVLVAVLYWLLA